MSETLTITIPLRLALGLNAREHHQVRARRVRTERYMTKLALHGRTLPSLPAVITITRVGKRRCDSDNVPGGAKGVRDQIADAYAVDDGSELYRWEYNQEIGREYAVKVKIETDLPARAQAPVEAEASAGGLI